MKKLLIHSVLFGVCILAGCKKDNRAFVIAKIQSAAKLTTTEVVIGKFVFASKEKKLLFVVPLNEAFYAAKSEATVKLGIDLNKIKREDISIVDQSISITLPPVEVLTFSYPFEKFKEDSTICDDAFLNHITVSDVEEYYRQGELDIRSNLQYMGLVERTRMNTRVLVKRLLSGLGYQEVYIDFHPQKELFGTLTEAEPGYAGI